jgi:hypothetical protein
MDAIFKDITLWNPQFDEAARLCGGGRACTRPSGLAPTRPSSA